MRSTQIWGLTQKAEKFLEENVARTEEKICPTCQHKSGGKQKIRLYDDISGRKAGIFEDGPSLFEYELKDGTFVKEIIQAVPWSSGPCIFLCLLDERGKKLFKWSKKIIENC